MVALAQILAIALLLMLGFALYLAQKTTGLARKAEAACPPLGKTITISTGALHYVDQGSGPVILLIHGLGGNLRTFTYALVEDLARTHRVIAIDRPGMGYSTRPARAAASPAAQAGYVEEVIDALALDRPLVVGHSLGGAISLALALRAPGKIRGLALLAPLVMPVAEINEAFAGLVIRTPLMRRLVAHTIAAPLALRQSPRTDALIFGPERRPRGFAVQGGGYLTLRPSAFYATSTDYMASNAAMPAQAPHHGEIAMPIHVLYGTEDRILDHHVQGIEAAKALPKMRLELVGGAGHMLPVIHPERCADFIRRADAPA